MTSQLESLKRQKEHFVRDFFHFFYFETETRRISCKCFLNQKDVTLPKSFPNHDLGHCVMSVQLWHCDSSTQHLPWHIAALAPSINDAATQIVVFATKKRHANGDIILVYSPCHAKRKRNPRLFAKKKPQKRRFCHVVSHFVSGAHRHGRAPFAEVVWNTTIVFQRLQLVATSKLATSILQYAIFDTPKYSVQMDANGALLFLITLKHFCLRKHKSFHRTVNGQGSTLYAPLGSLLQG